MKIVDPDHPVTKGVRDFVVTDEQHFMTYEKDPKHVLARSVNEDGLEYTDSAGRRSNTAEAAWAYDYDMVSGPKSCLRASSFTRRTFAF